MEKADSERSVSHSAAHSEHSEEDDAPPPAVLGAPVDPAPVDVPVPAPGAAPAVAPPVEPVPETDKERSAREREERVARRVEEAEKRERDLAAEQQEARLAKAESDRLMAERERVLEERRNELERLDRERDAAISKRENDQRIQAEAIAAREEEQRLRDEARAKKEAERTARKAEESRRAKEVKETQDAKAREAEKVARESALRKAEAEAARAKEELRILRESSPAVEASPVPVGAGTTPVSRTEVHPADGRPKTTDDGTPQYSAGPTVSGPFPAGLRGDHHPQVGEAHKHELTESLRAARLKADGVDIGTESEKRSPRSHTVDAATERMILARERAIYETVGDRFDAQKEIDDKRFKGLASSMNETFERFDRHLHAMTSMQDQLQDQFSEFIKARPSERTGRPLIQQEWGAREREGPSVIRKDTAAPSASAYAPAASAGPTVKDDTKTERPATDGPGWSEHDSPRSANDIGYYPRPDASDSFGMTGGNRPTDSDTPATPITSPDVDPTDAWNERVLANLRQQYDHATSEAEQQNILVKLMLLKPAAAPEPKKVIRNQVSTEKLLKEDDFRGSTHKRMLAERLWFDNQVRVYLRHASPDGGQSLFEIIQTLAYPFAVRYSQSATGEERASIIAEMDAVTRTEDLDKEIVNRFPAVFERALNKDTIRFHGEHFMTTPASHTRDPLSEMVVWRVASIVANGPQTPDEWVQLTRFVEAPMRVLRDADTSNVLQCWREWLSLAKETIKLGLTTPARIAPGMKQAVQEFMSYMSPESQFELRGKGFLARGLDHRDTKWSKLESMYDVMYQKCGFLPDEPELQKYLRKGSHAHAAGKQVSINPHPRPADRGRQARSPTPPSAKSSSQSRSRSGSRSRTASPALSSASRQSNVSINDNPKGVEGKNTANAAEEKKRKKSRERRASLAKKREDGKKANAAGRERSPKPRGRSPSPGAHPAQSGDTPYGECFEFARKGTCQYGSKCKFEHVKKGAAARDTSKGSSRERSKSPGGGGDERTRTCFNCDKPGHFSADCKAPKKTGEQICHFFKTNGHCRNGDECKYKHAAPPGKANAAATSDATSKPEPKADATKKPGFP